LIDGAKSFTQMAFVPMALLQKFLNSKNTKDDPVIFFRHYPSSTFWKMEYSSLNAS
jgi:hypothetical protein